MPDTWRKAGEIGPGENPYIHWWLEKNTAAQEMDFADFGTASGDTANAMPGASRVPIPRASQAPSSAEWSADALAGKLPTGIPADTVIVGIVDTGIALGHRAFRMADGKSRFIASWQQSAPFTSSRSGASQIPFGQELHADDIDRLIARHTGGAGGHFDEEAFNRDAALVEPQRLFGHRDLDHAEAHGTHVLDLAAGADPRRTDPKRLARQRIIAVNLPAQYAHGTAGNFLAYFAIKAFERILFLADALWEANKPKAGAPEGQTGYPVVINFSYGMTAGPKDGWHEIEAALRAMIEARRNAGKVVRVVMPIGNDNIDRCAASAMLGSPGAASQDNGRKETTSVTLPWRILPGDGTSNFVEIWSGGLDRQKAETLLAGLDLCVSPPGQGALAVGALADGAYYDLGDYARVYTRLRPGQGGTWRLAFLICAAPTLAYDGVAARAPAGAWRLEVANETDQATSFSFYVQSDQSAVRGSKTGQRSYFDHPKYRVFNPAGQPADTYLFNPGVAPVDQDEYAATGPVQRRGTHNAISSVSMDEIVCISSYNDLTGVPVIYSATCDPSKTGGGRVAPSASLPSENAPSLFGLLGAGSRDGSRVGYRGTSMAAALATRIIADAILDHTGGPDWPGTETWLKDKAEKAETDAHATHRKDHWDQHANWPDTREDKSGAGRLTVQRRAGQVGRLV